MTDNIIHEHAGFRFEREYEIPYMNMRVLKYVHKTGATLLYSDRDDGHLLFGIGFATAPWDDTGVFHILEHSVLDGSESYPLREPFNNLSRNSMATDLNAFTSADFTMYHFGSINEKDYRNMMSVYLDAVFHPLLLRDRRIFEKEAWRLEPDGNGGLIYNGVVYNEMQAALGQADIALWRALSKALLPDTAYAKVSGGVPSAIPDLTYENCCEIYKRFYRPDNSVIYLVGKMDLGSHLEYIDGVISGIKCNGEIPERPAIRKPVENLGVICEYPAADTAADEGESMLALAFGLPDGDIDTQHALDVAIRYMTSTLDSPLTKAILDSGIGQGFEAYTNNNVQNQIYFSVKKARSDDGEKFRSLVLTSLKSIVDEGFDKDKIARILDKQEVDVRLRSLNVYAAFGVILDVAHDSLFGGKNIGSNGIRHLREKLAENPEYLEDLLRECVLENKHCVLVTANPSKTLAADRDRATKAKLDGIRKNMSDAEYEKLCGYSQKFGEYLSTPDSEEALECLPKLTLDDLASGHEERFPIEKRVKISGVDVPELFFEADVNGFVTLTVGFDLKHISFDRLVYLQDTILMINDLGTDGMSPKERRDEFDAIQTNFRCRCSGYPSKRDDCPFYVEYRLTIPDKRIEKAVELLGKVMLSLNFDRDGVYRSLSTKLAGMRDLMMVDDGVSTALTLAGATLSHSAAYTNQSTLVPCYLKLKDDIDNFDKNADARISAMKSLYVDFTAAENMIIQIAGSKEDERAVLTELEKLNIPAGSAITETYLPTLLEKKNYAYAVENAVGYCVQSGNFADAGFKFKAAYNLIVSWLSDTLFWDEIRAKGGAYGGWISANREGSISLASYRDPHVENTYGVFARVADFIRSNIPTGKELESLIIAAAANYDKPASEFDKAETAFHRYLCKRPTTENEDRESILGITEKDFLDFADALEKMDEYGVSVAISSREKLESAGIFDEIVDM